MTSKQVMLALIALLIGGCALIPKDQGTDPLIGPYSQRRVWAVVPLRNESGSLYADGAALADHLARHLEGASNIDVVPVNRTLAAMGALQMRTGPTSRAQVMQLLQDLDVDGMVVGTISAYEPYDPPKLGLSLELYVHPRVFRQLEEFHVRQLSRSATDEMSVPKGAGRIGQPVASVSAFLDAGDPVVRHKLERYAYDRGSSNEDVEAPVLYRISMDLYREFVAYVMSWRLLEAESQRLTWAEQTQPVP